MTRRPLTIARRRLLAGAALAALALPVVAQTAKNPSPAEEAKRLDAVQVTGEIDDVFGEHQFNDQSDDLGNVGFIHEIPFWQASFGVTRRKQGEAYGRVVGEEVTTRHGADVEACIEQRFGQHSALQLTGSNLDEASKDEIFDRFNTIDTQIGRDHEEYELEPETGGPIYPQVARYSF
jgi:hypothetical protein